METRPRPARIRPALVLAGLAIILVTLARPSGPLRMIDATDAPTDPASVRQALLAEED